MQVSDDTKEPDEDDGSVAGFASMILIGGGGIGIIAVVTGRKRQIRGICRQ